MNYIIQNNNYITNIQQFQSIFAFNHQEKINTMISSTLAKIDCWFGTTNSILNILFNFLFNSQKLYYHYIKFNKRSCFEIKTLLFLPLKSINNFTGCSQVVIDNYYKTICINDQPSLLYSSNLYFLNPIIENKK